MSKSRQTRRLQQRRIAAFELLENRHLLAASTLPFVLERTLAVSLDQGNDVVNVIYLDASTARMTVNGTNYDFARSSFDDISILDIGGNDQFVIAADVTTPADIRDWFGNDSIVGGAGDDTIWDTLGNDTIFGGAGNDELVARELQYGFTDAWKNGFTGPAPLSFSRDSIFGGDGNDFIWGNSLRDTLDGGTGSNTIKDVNDFEPLGVRMIYPDAEAPSEDDTITISFINATTARATINGVNYDFDRTLVNEVVVDAGDGNDLVTVDASVDVPVRISGGNGNDTVIGGGTNDSIYGGPGDDSLVGNDGNDSLIGEDGNDSLYGGNGNDSLDGGMGNDSLDGGPGNDTLYGNMMNDTIWGGGGDDYIVMSPGSDDLVIDTSGNDTLDFTPAARGISLDLGKLNGEWQIVDANRNGVALVGLFEIVIGSRFDDHLVGNSLANRIDGGAGNDTLDGGGGDRTLYGKPDGSKPDRSARPGTDGDELFGGEGNDWLDGGRGRDLLDGGNGDDTLVADLLVDKVFGGAGNNVDIPVVKDVGGISGLGDVGFAEDFTGISFALATGVLVVRGDATGPSNDHIVVSANAAGWLVLHINGLTYSADPDSSDFTVDLADATIFTVTAVKLRGGQGNDTLVVGAIMPTTQVVLAGGAGNDLLVGGLNGELLRGGAGNDTLQGGAGNDVLVGGRGDDSLDGGLGHDTADYTAALTLVEVDFWKGRARGDGLDLLFGLEAALGPVKLEHEGKLV
jgi:Ca2+-binding RTX toxin-like protein